MYRIPFSKIRINQTYFVHLRNSNNFIQLEEPAWYVFRKKAMGYKSETIAEAFTARYDTPLKESHSFVNKIVAGIEKMNQQALRSNNFDELSAGLEGYFYQTYSVRYYQFGKTTISFSFESERFEYYIHPLISHFEIKGETKQMLHFELFAFQKKIVFKAEGKVKGHWNKDETHLVKGEIFMSLINVIYKKTDADWLMTVHASAITDGKKTVLFSAPPNHGKTTIAALLQHCGFRIVSDDFVPVHRESFVAYPLPIAMSVKQTSMDLLEPLYPALNAKKLNYISAEKSVRFLPSESNYDFESNLFPIHDFIFIAYNKQVDFELEKLDAVQAMKLLLDQTWVVPNAGNAEVLFAKIQQLSFYRLTYSNNQKAIDAIKNIFENDQ